MDRMEKTRAFLTEFIIVILFFTVSAVITLQLFVNANKKSVESTALAQGSLRAESIIEEIKGNIDFDSENVLDNYIVDVLGYKKSQNGQSYYQYFDKEYNVVSSDDAYILGRVILSGEKTSAGTLYTVKVTFENSEKTIVSLETKIYNGEVQ